MILVHLKSRIYWIFLLVFSVVSGCKTNNEKPISIGQFINLENISAGSGICQTKAGLWIVGDDSPFLYLINDEGEIQYKYVLSGIPAYGHENYSKIIKPDFEAIDVFNDTLLIIGSGSQEFTRDTAFVFDSQNRLLLLKRSLHNLYQKFYLKGDFPVGNSINIEGLANDGSFFYFLHRGNICGNNRIYRVNKKEMIDYLFDDQSELPDFTSFIFDLPMIAEYRSGFSGACYNANENALYVTISVEGTNDVYHDGEILGSFIGKIKINDYIPKEDYFWPITETSGKFEIVKLESLCINQTESSEIRFFVISDNDTGKTGFYQFLLP